VRWDFKYPFNYKFTKESSSEKMFNWFTFDVSYGYEFVASHFWSTMYMPDKVTDIKSNSAPHWRHQLWGTGARAPLELGHVKKIWQFLRRQWIFSQLTPSSSIL